MPLKLTKRPGSGFWYIRGTVRGQGVFETTGTSIEAYAETIRAKREAQLHDEAVFGKRAVVKFARAALSYLDFEERSQRTKDYVGQLVDHFGPHRTLTEIDQTAADEAVIEIVGIAAAPSTKVRIVYTPLTAVMMHAHDRRWCDRPNFRRPSIPKTKPNYLKPLEAVALIAAAAPHLKPLITFSLCTGTRMSEALALEWEDVDLAAAECVLRNVKARSGAERDRVAALTPAAIVTLATLPFQDEKKKKREGKVFRREDGEPYIDREGYEGGQIKTAWNTACRRAGLASPVLDEKGNQRRDKRKRLLFRPSVTPHDMRHTFATWFYALSKDLLLLKAEGGWETLSIVERYAHLMQSDLIADISLIWGASHPKIGTLPMRAFCADSVQSKKA